MPPVLLTLEDAEAIADVLEVRLQQTLTVSDAEQLLVLLNAFQIYKERNARYRDLWKQFGAQDNAHHLKSKGLRTLAEIERVMDGEGPAEEVDLDDAFDAINYAVFTIRNVRNENLD